MKKGHLNQLQEIKVGYSIREWKGRPIYFKHPTLDLYAEMDRVYDSYMQKANGRVPDLETRTKELKESGEWTDSDEQEIEQIYIQLENSRKGLLKAVPQIEGMLRKQIVGLEEKLIRHQTKKATVFGRTAEFFANKYANERFVSFSSFSDKELNNLFLNEDEFDDLSDTEMIELTTLYNKAINRFSDEALKALAVDPMILQYSYLKDNFFEIPMLDLSFFQFRLVVLCQNYKAMLEQTPEGVDGNIRSSYDLLEEWHGSSQDNKARMEAGVERKNNPKGSGWGAEQIRKNIDKDGNLNLNAI